MFGMILFDVDGVLLSEERYFDASALTVWELIHSQHYLGIPSSDFTPSPKEETIRRIRQEVFANDETLYFIKGRGINANWDMVYLTFSYQLILVLEKLCAKDHDFVQDVLSRDIDRDALESIRKKASHLLFSADYESFCADFEHSTAEKQELLLYLNTIIKQKTGIETSIFSRKSQLWDICQEAFQEWYLGDDLVELSIHKKPVQTGKRGFLDDEIPIVDPKEMAKILQALKDKGITLGIGTGRPEIETIEPLKALGLLEYFDENRIISASYVLDAERKYPDHAPLAKPQPYCYVQGYLGKETDVSEAIHYPLPLANKKDILIVGDSLADYMAAKSIGCTFVATLTGLSGQEARGKFEELKADYILNDASELLTIFKYDDTLCSE